MRKLGKLLFGAALAMNCRRGSRGWLAWPAGIEVEEGDVPGLVDLFIFESRFY